jgi:transposase
MENREQTYIGVDVSKDSLDVAIHGVRDVMRVSNDGAGVRKIVRLAVNRDAALVCFEATGGYEVKLWMALTEAGLNPAPSNPRLVRHFAQGAGRLAKTDVIDARVIADYACAMEPRITPFPETNALKEIVARRCQLIEMIVAEKNRFKTSRIKVLREDIQTNIEWLQTKVEKIDKELEAGIKVSPEWKDKDQLLQSVPGVGKILSACLVAQLPELGTLNNKRIAALVGVAPLNHDSGKSHGKRSPWGGRSRVRAALYMATLAATRCNPIIRQFYSRLCAAGKLKKVAIIACMRKLIIILNAMVKNHTLWQSVDPVSATVA